MCRSQRQQGGFVMVQFLSWMREDGCQVLWMPQKVPDCTLRIAKMLNFVRWLPCSWIEETGFHVAQICLVAKDGLDLPISLSPPPRCRVTGLHHHTWFVLCQGWTLGFVHIDKQVLCQLIRILSPPDNFCFKPHQAFCIQYAIVLRWGPNPEGPVHRRVSQPGMDIL